MPPPSRNHRTPTAGDTPASTAASSLVSPARDRRPEPLPVLPPPHRRTPRRPHRRPPPLDPTPTPSACPSQPSFDQVLRRPVESALYAGAGRVRVRFGRADFLTAEVAHEKDKEATLQPAYGRARELGRSFEEQAEEEYEAMVRWVLGPLADPGFAAELARKQTAAAFSQWTAGPGAILTILLGARTSRGLGHNFPQARAESSRPHRTA